ncbi:MAG: hypothetical protein ABI760_15140 [Ferruginibacter sp.]
MRKHLYVIVFLFLGLYSQARILRVGLTGIPPVTNVDYTYFYDAYASASNGDTIYVFPGNRLDGLGWTTSGQQPEIEKRLVIISKGNWLDDSAVPKGNSGLQASKGTATIGVGAQNLYFKPGSKGSVLMGFNCQNSQGGQIFLQDDSITIKRNYDCLIYFDNYSLKNLDIEGNYRVWFKGNNNVANVYSNIIIRNNFIYQLQLPQKKYSGLIANNTWAYDNTGAANGGFSTMSHPSSVNLNDGVWIFENNLFMSYTSSVSNNSTYFLITNGENAVFNYNVALQSNNMSGWPGISTGNVFVAPGVLSTIVEGFPVIGTRSADNRYMLKAGSPATQAARTGSSADAGMFGGVFPYNLGNIPAIPTIYSISSPQGNTVTGTSIQINISTRSNN